jgi:hypothetical protein
MKRIFSFCALALLALALSASAYTSSGVWQGNGCTVSPTNIHASFYQTYFSITVDCPQIFDVRRSYLPEACQISDRSSLFHCLWSTHRIGNTAVNTILSTSYQCHRIISAVVEADSAFGSDSSPFAGLPSEWACSNLREPPAKLWKILAP